MKDGEAMSIKIGVIGCGSISEFRHAPEYWANENAEIVAFYDPKRERAERLVKQYGGTAAKDFKDITQNPSIDAISDCSTNEMHHVISTDALEHGKHVLCEKPMATTLEGARKMIEAGKKAGKILMIGHNQRLAPGHRKAKEILESGELGRVITFQTVFGHRGPEYWSENKTPATWFFDRNRSVFGAPGDLGIHKIDLIRYLLDDEIEEVSSFVGTLDKKQPNGELIPVNDNMLCLLRTKKGAMGTLAVSWTYYGPEDNATTLHCEKGIMKIYGDPAYQVVASKRGGDAAYYKVGQIQTNESQSNSGVIDAFISCIINKTPPPVSGEDGLKGLQVVFAAIESSRKRVATQISSLEVPSVR
jgi:predicted dehydrogenase